MESFSTNAHRVWRGFAKGVLRVFLRTVLCFKWPVEKHCVAKFLKGISDRFSYENNRDYDFYKFSYKFAFISFLSSGINQKEESSFQQLGGLVTRNISVFRLYIVALYFKGMKLFYLHCSCKKVVEKSNKENLKVVKIILPNRSGKPESHKKIRSVGKLSN